MPSDPHDPGNVTTVAIEIDFGWAFFKVADPKPEPSRIEFFLRRAIEEWFAERPSLVIKKATPITKQGELLGIHVWYDPVDAEPPKKPVEFGIDLHGEIAAIHSGEYIEAVLTEALTILPQYEDRKDCLVLISPRKVAVILDKQANRGVVIQAALIERVVEGEAQERLRAWLASHVPPFHVMHLTGNHFLPEG